MIEIKITGERPAETLALLVLLAEHTGGSPDVKKQ